MVSTELLRSVTCTLTWLPLHLHHTFEPVMYFGLVVQLARVPMPNDRGYASRLSGTGGERDDGGERRTIVAISFKAASPPGRAAACS